MHEPAVARAWVRARHKHAGLKVLCLYMASLLMVPLAFLAALLCILLGSACIAQRRTPSGLWIAWISILTVHVRPLPTQAGGHPWLKYVPGRNLLSLGPVSLVCSGMFRAKLVHDCNEIGPLSHAKLRRQTKRQLTEAYQNFQNLNLFCLARRPHSERSIPSQDRLRRGVCGDL